MKQDPNSFQLPVTMLIYSSGLFASSILFCFHWMIASVGSIIANMLIIGTSYMHFNETPIDFITYVGVLMLVLEIGILANET